MMKIFHISIFKSICMFGNATISTLFQVTVLHYFVLQILQNTSLRAPHFTHEWAIMDETHGWRNRETQTLIAMWVDESISIGIISEMNSAIFAYLYISGNSRLDLHYIHFTKTQLCGKE